MRRLFWFSLSMGLAALVAVQYLPAKISCAGGFFCLLAAFLLPVTFPKGKAFFRWCGMGLAVGLLWTCAWNGLFWTPMQEAADVSGTFSGVVTGYPTSATGGYALPVRLTVEDRTYTALLYLTDFEEEPIPGDTFTCVAACSPASTAKLASGVQMTASCKAYHLTGHRDSIRYLPARCAHWLRASLLRIYAPDTVGLFLALLTGDKSELSTSLQTALQRVGLSHLVAVSGLHLGLLAYLFLHIFSSKWGRLLSMPILVFFALMVNTVSCWRALLMFLLVLAAPFFSREEDGLTSLGFALVVILFRNPYAITSVSLQLSFLSVLGIFLLESSVQCWLNRCFGRRDGRLWQQMLQNALSGLLLTLCATCFSLPVAALHFGQISLISPLSNLLITWTLPFLFLGGLVSAMLLPLSTVLASLTALLPDLLAKGVVGTVFLLSRFPFASLQLDSVYGVIWLVSGYLVLLLLFTKRVPARSRVISLAGVALLLVAALGLQRLSYWRNDLTVKVLDVGQGQCILLVSKDQAVAIDCGSNSYSSAGDLLADQLQTLGKQNLDLLIVTHSDADHTNGLSSLYARIQVDTLFLSDPTDDSTAELAALAEEYNSVVNYITVAQTFSFGQAQVTIYPPVVSSGDNNASLAVLCTSGAFSMLVTGDMDTVCEGILLAQEEISPVDVLMVGHHGSKYATSEALLAQTTPQVAVISVGQNNYGHPTQEVLERLAQQQIPTYRTDENGTLTFCVKND